MLLHLELELCRELGIINVNAGIPQHAIFIVDLQGVIRFVHANGSNVSRDLGEVLRVTADLQDGFFSEQVVSKFVISPVPEATPKGTSRSTFLHPKNDLGFARIFLGT